MTILLDIDGVLITTPAWKQTEQMNDGFLKFNDVAWENLITLYDQTKAAIVLTTTHRISFSEEKWKNIFNQRGLPVQSVSKVNEKTTISEIGNRGEEIQEWVDRFGSFENYVIIDDDNSISALPENVKNRWVRTKALIGFDNEAREEALNILLPKTTK